jgi:GNAT superfamily N-acetyltransferase
VDIRQLDPFDEAATASWYAAMRAGAEAGRTTPMTVSRSALATSLRTNADNPYADRRAFAAWDGERCLGTVMVDLPRVENRHLAEMDVIVSPPYRRRGVGDALYAYALDVIRSAGRTTVIGEINVAPGGTLADSAGGAFAVRYGYASRHVEHRLMLDLPVPVERFTGVDGYRTVSWLGLPPAEYLDAFADMHTLMDRDVPSGDLDLEPTVYDGARILAGEGRLIEQGWDLVTTMVLDAAGGPAGYTAMYRMGEHVLQGDTFVLRAHRGHRLGALAKATNLRRLAGQHPDARHVHTWTAEVNGAMRAINDRFGFRDVETLHEVELSLGNGS